ncbi:MAG: hypothetical protein NTY73_04360, partial [Candidatus Micrarchaeota archaeon]|nr:hypothetical protein [Candidatus Micrarchaeota archaeon]
LSASSLAESFITNPYRQPERHLLLDSVADNLTQLDNYSPTENTTLANLPDENLTINETANTPPPQEPIPEEISHGVNNNPIEPSYTGRIASISTRHIEILQQEYIDSYFNWNFEEINETNWKASFTIDEGLWNDAKNCNSEDDAAKPGCFREFRGKYFSNILKADDAVKLGEDIASMRNYPLANLTPNIRFSDFNIDLESGTGSFYIIFPHGFKEGERAKFGFNSTVIYSTLGETEPFRASGRAICRTNNAIHVVAINGTTNVSYFKSTDGITWTSKKLDGSATGDNPVAASEVAIACSGTNVFVVWNGGASGYDIQYMNSSDEGVTWSSYISNVAPKWFDGTGSSNLAGAYVSAEFGIGKNIWVAWVDDAGSIEAIIVDNSTLYGGNLPTMTRKNMTGDVNVGASPNIIVNISGSTEEVYVPYFNASNSDIQINRTVNGGTTWTGGSITAGTFIAGAHSGVIMNNTIYVVYTTGSSVTIKNSTDRGATWSAAQTIATETVSDPTIASDGVGTLFVFWNNGTVSTNANDVRYSMWSAGTGWSSAATQEELNSYVLTRINAKFNWSGNGIEYVFINRTASSGNADLRYGYWLPSITFTNPQNNNSNAKPNDVVNFSINVTTNYGYLSGYIFSNNFTGSGWQNSSWVPVSGTVKTAIIWNDSYTATSPNVYGWRFYANVTRNYIDNSSDQTFNFSTRILQVSWTTGSVINSTSCTSGIPCQIMQYNNFTANATAQCSTQPADLSCGTVSGTIRYNNSGETPDTLISTTGGATPFYTGTNSQSCGSLSHGNSCTLNWTVNATGIPPDTRALDANFSSSLTNNNPPTNNTDSAYVTIIAQVVGFTITLPGQIAIVAAEGGNATAGIEFNLTGGNTASNIDPCLAGTATCQTSGTPIFVFTNTGTVTLNWYVYLDTALPASMTLKGDTDNNPVGATTITTAGWPVASSIAPTGSQNAWLWADFSGASVDDATSRTLKNNATSS